MKVALTFPGCHRRGGVERIMLECARFLVTQNHDVHVFANEFDPTPPDEVSAAIRFHHVALPRIPAMFKGPAFYSKCGKALNLETFDVVNSHGCVCPLDGVMWAQSIHAAWLNQSRKMRSSLSASRCLQRVNPLHPMLLQLERRHFVGRRYQKIIATTQAVREDLNIFYGVPPEDVTIMPNGFSPLEFNPEKRVRCRKAAREQLGIKDGEILLIFVANELTRKGYLTVLDALKNLQRPNIRLIVAGRSNPNRAMRLAQAAGVADQVKHIGPSSDVSLLHAAADIFVLPTQYEAFCLAILEALGSGVPVITSKVPGAHDAIVPGINGLTIDDPNDGKQLAQALTQMLDGDLRLTMEANAPGTVTQYQWPHVLKAYERVLIENSTASDRLNSRAGFDQKQDDSPLRAQLNQC